MNKKAFCFGLAILGINSLSTAYAVDGCPVVTTGASEVQVQVESQGMITTVKLGLNGEINSISALANSKSSSIDLPLATQNFFNMQVVSPLECSNEECGPIEVRRYRLGADISFITYPFGNSKINQIIRFENGAVVSNVCYNSIDNFDLDSFLESIDQSQLVEQFGESFVGTCSEEELCPSIYSASIIYATDGGANQRGGSYLHLERAKTLVNRALKTNGVSRQKTILTSAISELKKFVKDAKFKSSSKSYQKGIRADLALANRAVKTAAGPKLVKAALLAIKSK